MQAFITISLALTIIYLTVNSLPTPDRLWDAFWATLGFWFGSQLARTTNNAQQNHSPQAGSPPHA